MTDRKHSHYFKPCPFLHVDVYRVLDIFGVTDPCIQDIEKDIQEAIDTLERWQEMRSEENK